jgi:hypothetical protein
VQNFYTIVPHRSAYGFFAQAWQAMKLDMELALNVLWDQENEVFKRLRLGA